MNQTLQKLITVKEAAEILGCAPQTIYNSISRRSKQRTISLKPRRIGRLVRFKLSDVLEYIDKLE